jgi:hypothetical protein
MALTDENGSGMVMPVAPMYGNNGGGWGNGFGGDGWWIILLLLLCGNGMWGGFGGINGFGGGLGIDFPWLLNGQNNINSNVNDGFRDAQLHDSVTSVRDGISALATQLCGCCGDIQNSLCSGFAGVTASVNNAQNAIAQQMYGNTIADLERSFAAQTATMNGFNGVNAGIADVRYTLASEGCATRENSTQNTQGILNAINGGIQSIKDQLCQDKIDAKNDEIATLRQQIAMKDLAASQTAQNAFIAQGFSNEVDQLYNRLNSCPVPTTPVYGRTPIFTCNNNSGCGCGCNGGF